MLFKKKISNGSLRTAEQRTMIGDRLNFEASEAYKLLRTNIEFSLPDEKKCRIIGVTSGMRGEGKTTTAINLAYSFAEAGKKVLLLEADMRLPTIAKRIGLVSAPGLSNLLAGLCTGSEVLQSSRLLPNFYVTTAGNLPPNPSELLGSEQMVIAMKSMAQEFDFIVLDLPPVNVVSDALVASKLISGMIVVVRQNYSNRQSVSEAIRHLSILESKILGFVMTRANEQKRTYKKYASKYSYSGDYRAGYERASHQKKEGNLDHTVEPKESGRK